MYRFNGMPLHCVPFSSMIVVTVLRKSKVEPWPARCFTLAVGLEQHNEQRSNRCFEFIGGPYDERVSGHSGTPLRCKKRE